ncbi:MAG: restriction endonuclease subunit S [Methanobacteriaceae archaeon]
MSNNFPILRFKEFNDEWEAVKLGNFSKIVAGATPKTSQIDYWEKGNIPWLSSGEINNKKIYFTKKLITSKGYKNSSTKLVPKNSILIALAGQGKTRGTVAINKIELCTNQSVASIVTTSKLNYCFVYYNLEKRYDELRRISSSDGGRGGLNLKLIKNISVNIPTLNEQEQIADFLSLVDKKIELLEKSYSLYESMKKSFMEQIFSQEIRFKDEVNNDYPQWDYLTLGDISNIQTGKLNANAMSKNGKYRFYTCAKEYFFINEYAFDTDALLISGNGANVGYIHHFNGKFNAYQRTYVLDKFKNHDIIFIKFTLERHLKKRIEQEKNQGNTPYIVLSTLKDIKLEIPKFREQQKISEFLKDLDGKIGLIKKELAVNKRFKSGLLQKMFI